jgi:hypothetical protein
LHVERAANARPGCTSGWTGCIHRLHTDCNGGAP